MKQFSFLLVTLFAVLLSSVNGFAQDSQSNNSDGINKIEVINFYGTHRCATCKAIEANTKYTLDTYFAQQLESEKIIHRAINVDANINYKIAEKFEASGTALFLNVIKNGEDKAIDLTELAFSKGRDQKAFSKELKSKIEHELEQ